MIFSKTATLLCFTIPVLTWGCGSDDEFVPPPGVIVTGQLLRDGQPLPMKRPDVGVGSVNLTFVSLDKPDQEKEYTSVDAEGKFRLEGAGAGIPPGRYRIAVIHDENGIANGNDDLDGKYSESNSPIEVEIPVGGDHNLGILDLKDYPVK